jgi:hypothetical protein
MKKLLLISLLLALVGGAAGADSLTVNNTAAMGGVGTNCTGSNCGLDVFHDNSDAAYVEDTTPANETIYRGTLLFSPEAFPSPGFNLRQTIVQALGPNPNPGAGSCGVGAFRSPFRIFFYLTGGIGQIYNVQIWGLGNLCGESAATRIQIPDDGPSRVCWEFETGPSLTGRVALAVVDVLDACPPSGDAAWEERTVSNHLTNVTQIRVGTPQTNAFGGVQTGNLYFDEVATFRTLTP